MQATPPVERVRGGLWSIPVPIPDNPLGYTLVYLLESDAGPVLVDAGWDDPSSLAALERGVAATEHRLDEVEGVLVTHHHPDHHGLSGHVRAASGAWIAMHPEDAEAVTRRRMSVQSEWLVQTAMVLLEAGASEEDLAGLPTPDDATASPPEPAVPNRLLGDGDRLEVPGWELTAVWTPGHTPGHLCFAVNDHDLLLSGDHVLPEITPHIGVYDEERDLDPLGDYLESLHRLRRLGSVEVLPAHQHRFTGLDARLDTITAHHEQRFEAVERALAEGPASAWAVAAAMPWNRAWTDLGAMMKRAALSEALAHIRYLEHRGRVRAVPGSQPVTFELAQAPDRAPTTESAQQ